VSNLGYPFEIETLKFFRSLEYLTSEDSSVEPNYKSYRVQGSGADKNSPYSAKLTEDIGMDGDILAELAYLNKKIQVECKHYASETPATDKSLRLQKNWLDQNKKEAEVPDKYGQTRYSLVAVKFKDAGDVHYLMPKGHFKKLMDYIREVKEGKNVSLKDFSTEELIMELTGRIK